MNYKNLREENEILSADDEKTRLLVGSLKKVDAPKDFDFRLKARIANAKYSDFQPRYFPVLRRVLPLGLVVLILAFAVFNNLYLNDSPNVVPQIAETRQPNPVAARNGILEVLPTPDNSELTTAIVDSDIAKRDERKSTRVSTVDLQPTAKKSNKKPKTNLSKENFGGSLDSASTGSAGIAPIGLNPNKAIKISPDFEIGKSVGGKEILSQLGIEADFTAAGWLVKSVRQNSLAERSSVKAGDTVESLDGEKLTDKPLSSRKIEGKKLTVARGTEKIEINLGN